MKTWYMPASAMYVPKYKEVLNGAHTLIGGTTGSGKSVVLNGIIHTALALYAPSSAKFVLIDPKGVELSDYEELPHTLAYARHAKDTAEILERLCVIMEDRFTKMKEKHIKLYDGQIIFVIIDELADLMVSEYSARIRRAMQKLLQKGRASQIRLIAATQAPNRKVIPAELVLNFTNRIALRCLSPIESRQIVNIKGAETINEYGKALYLSPSGFAWLTGLPFISEAQIQERVSFWVKQN